MKLEFIRPGKPVENGYVESFHGRLRDECLNVNLFFGLADARRKLESWRQDYNTVRPHGSLNDMTPEEFRAGYDAEQMPPALQRRPGMAMPESSLVRAVS